MTSPPPILAPLQKIHAMNYNLLKNYFLQDFKFSKRWLMQQRSFASSFKFLIHCAFLLYCFFQQILLFANDFAKLTIKIWYLKLESTCNDAEFFRFLLLFSWKCFFVYRKSQFTFVTDGFEGEKNCCFWGESFRWEIM